MRNKQRAVILGGIMILIAASVAQATTYAWTNTTTGCWTNSANWSPSSSTPGAASGDTANLIQSFAGAYTNILNTGLANSLTTLTLSNASGQACLIVTNNTLNVATLNLCNGGLLELDNGAVLNTTSALNWTGTNGVIVLNAGGTLSTPSSTWYFGNSASGITGLVTSTGNQGGLWNLGGQLLQIGNGTASGDTLSVANGVVATNWNIRQYGAACALTITNGATVYAKSGSNFQIGGNGGSVVVGEGNQTSTLNMNGGEIWVGQQAANNNFTIDVNGVVTNVTGSFYAGGVIVGWNQNGYVGISNSLTVKNGGQLWANALTVGYIYDTVTNLCPFGNTVLISSGLVNVAGAVKVGGGAGAPQIPSGSWNSLTITNGGQLKSTGASTIGGNGNVGNSVTVSGAGSTWNLGGTSLGMNSTGNVLTVANGGMITNGSAVTANSSSTVNNSIIVTNGGKILGGSLQIDGTGNSVWLGGGNQTSTWNVTGDVLFPQASGAISSGNTLTIDANGVMNASGASYGVAIGFEQGQYAYNNSLTVQNGGQLWINTAKGLTLGYYLSGTAGSSNNAVLITSGGYVNSTAGGVTVGSSSYSTQNTLRVTTGGVLEANTLTVGNYTGNSLTNNGGIFQFTSSSPTITPGSFGRIGITNGTVSFRAVTNADVLCNQSGGSNPLDSAAKMAWYGANTFCLNAASNNTSGQAYTFSTVYGATNFACLELMNGATYRGGLVTIGSGGTLLITNGANTIATNLGMQSSSTLALNLGANTNSSLLVQGTANFSGATLQVGLGAAPPVAYAYPIVTATSVAANFGARIVNATYGGTNYTLTVGNSGGVITLTRATGGTTVFFR
jgi:hypothetical protein